MNTHWSTKGSVSNRTLTVMRNRVISHCNQLHQLNKERNVIVPGWNIKHVFIQGVRRILQHSLEVIPGRGSLWACCSVILEDAVSWTNMDIVKPHPDFNGSRSYMCSDVCWIVATPWWLWLLNDYTLWGMRLKHISVVLICTQERTLKYLVQQPLIQMMISVSTKDPLILHHHLYRSMPLGAWLTHRIEIL